MKFNYPLSSPSQARTLINILFQADERRVYAGPGERQLRSSHQLLIGDIPDYNETSPIHTAVNDGTEQHELVRLLLSNRVDPNVKDKQYGRTPLHYACLRGHINVTNLLLDYNSIINADDNDQVTPLHLACRGLHLQVAKKLLSGMADPAAKDQGGRTPLHEAYSAHDSTQLEIESIMQPSHAPPEFRHVAAAQKSAAKRNDDLLRELVTVLVDKGGNELLENRDYTGELPENNVKIYARYKDELEAATADYIEWVLWLWERRIRRYQQLKFALIRASGYSWLVGGGRPEWLPQDQFDLE